jgi:hypothetical protein
MRLGRVLGPRAGKRLVRRYPAYLVEAGEDEIDLLQFSRLCRDGRAAAGAGSWQQALAILEGLQHPDADRVRAKLASTNGHASSNPTA